MEWFELVLESSILAIAVFFAILLTGKILVYIIENWPEDNPPRVTDMRIWWGGSDLCVCGAGQGSHCLRRMRYCKYYTPVSRFIDGENRPVCEFASPMDQYPGFPHLECKATPEALKELGFEDEDQDDAEESSDSPTE